MTGHFHAPAAQSTQRELVIPTQQAAVWAPKPVGTYRRREKPLPSARERTAFVWSFSPQPGHYTECDIPPAKTGWWKYKCLAFNVHKANNKSRKAYGLLFEKLDENTFLHVYLAMKAQGVALQLHVFLIVTLRFGVLSFTPRPIYQQRKS